jgi:hypothetical protein
MKATEYWLLVKASDGRVIRHDTWGVIAESGQGLADAEAMKCLGERLIREARAIKARHRDCGVTDDCRRELAG